MKNSRLFSDNEISYDEYLKKIEEVLSNTPNLLTKNNLEEGIDALTKIDDPTLRQKMIGVSIFIDKNFGESFSREDEAYRKIPIIMTLANIVGNHYDKVSNLDNEQLAMLGWFFMVVNNDSVEENLNLFGNKELLSSVLEKTKEKDEFNDILGVIENKYFENSIDKADELSLNKFQNEMITMVKTNSKEQLLSMVKPIGEIVRDLENKGYPL